MNYKETISYLFNSAPLFQQVGGAAYKPGLQTTVMLDEHFNHPHHRFKTVHVGGTNGKGSTAHTLAALLQIAGYKVGLFTSPHLVDFRERIRVNGEMVPEQYVVDFVEKEKSFFEPLHPSFFELTTALAFKYFDDQKVDVAVVEVGLGGRLDCTNIIIPVLSIITNISFDHMQFLGDTLEKIAGEKAGIMKSNVPVVVGETCPETQKVFVEYAAEVGAELHLAEEEQEVLSSKIISGDLRHYHTVHWGDFEGQLIGDCQVKNTNTILCALNQLSRIFHFSPEQVHIAFRKVADMTGLRGRWEIIQKNPLVVCDAGHNTGGWEYLARQLEGQSCHQLHLVFGMVSDKDVRAVLAFFICRYFHLFFPILSLRCVNGNSILHR